LENTGDYWGLKVLRYYQTYRAMVRAKVAGIRLIQAEEGDPKNTVIQKELESYIQLAEQLIQPLHPWLILTHGLSGSGKTTVTQSLLEALGAIRIRSDVERKRLFDLRSQVSTQAKLNEGMYTPEATNTTYEYLKKLTRKILEAGYPTIVDATFLHRQHRNTFQDLAQTLRIPFLILNVHAPEMELRARIAARAMENQDASDADLAVLTHQLRNQEELGKEELPFTLSVDSRFPLDLKAIKEVLASNKEGKA
jgi:hypothetical protein